MFCACFAVWLLLCSELSMPAGIRTYTSADLVSLNTSTRPPSRSIRKAIFALRIWRPANRGVRPGSVFDAHVTSSGDADLSAVAVRAERATQSESHAALVSPSDADMTTTTTLPAGTPKSTHGRHGLNFATWNAQSLGNKFSTLHNIIIERKLDICAVTECWHPASSDITLLRAAPPGYRFIDEPRGDGAPHRRRIGVVLPGRVQCWADRPSSTSNDIRAPLRLNPHVARPSGRRRRLPPGLSKGHPSLPR